jgi:flagellar basal-body rod protein FlgF
MNTSLYVGLSRQMTLQRALDIAANNIANADTAGFKVEEQIVREEPATPPSTPGAKPIAYVLDEGVARDFSQGAIEETGNPFDVAIEGQGFFQVQTGAGERYTRDGRFSVDNQNRLVTKAGDPVLSSNGRPIVLDPAGGAVSIAKDGTLSQGATPLGRLGVFRFADLAALTKAGGNLFQASDVAGPVAAPDAVVRQGQVERSNVQPVLEITNLIEITRAYERVARMMDQTESLSSRAIDRLGRAA